MSLLFIDSFDHYRTAEIIAKWTTITITPTISIGTGRCGSNAMAIGTSADFTLGLPFASTTTVVGFAIDVITTLGQNELLKIGTSSTTPHLVVTRELDGSLRVYRDNPLFGTLLGSTAANVIQTGIYYFLEFKSTIDDVAGSVELRVNGTTVLTVAGVDTKVAAGAATPTYVRFQPGGNYSALMDDFYALDSVGPAPQNDFLGDIHVEYLRPTAAGAMQDFTVVGAASHWQAVDDGDNPDEDTSYVTSATAGQIDTNIYGNTILPSGTIFGVQLNLYARKTDSGFRQVAPVVRHAGVNQTGANQEPSFTSYRYLRQLYALNPGTGVAWSIANVNDDEYGVALTT